MHQDMCYFRGTKSFDAPLQQDITYEGICYENLKTEDSTLYSFNIFR